MMTKLEDLHYWFQDSNKQIVVYVCSRIPLGRTKAWSLKQPITAESQKHDIKPRKVNTEDHRLFESFLWNASKS